MRSLHSAFTYSPLHLDVLLPVGISFYTFESLSYTLDVYRGKLRADAQLPEVRVLRHLLPAPGRRADRARRRLTAAARAPAAAHAAGGGRGAVPDRDRPHEKSGDCGLSRAQSRRSRLRRSLGVHARSRCARALRVHPADLLRLLGLHRRRAWLGQAVRSASCPRTSTGRTRRPARRSSGAAGT